MHEKYLDEQCVGFLAADDGTFRIQGSFALDDANPTSFMSAAYFSSIYAIMYAVHHPVESMNYRSVDVILENGKKIASDIDLDEYQVTRTLKGVVVDTTSYKLLTVDYTPKEAKLDEQSSEEEVKISLKEFFTLQKYGLIRSKCCYLVIVKEGGSYFLFDPYVDENSPASWFKLEDLQAVFSYLLTWKCQDPVEIACIRIQSVKVLSYKKIKPPKVGYFLFNFPSTPSPSNQKACQSVEESENEKIEWITSTKTIPWSRLETRNAMNVERYLSTSKWKEFDIEMDNKLYSLWGNIHPNMKVFKIHAGKQHLTCAVISLVMSHMYNIDEWDAVLLDSVVAHGHKYYVESIGGIQQQNYQLKVEDLQPVCSINNFVFKVDIKPIIYGSLYDENKRSFNLNRALNYVFRHKNLPGVILQCNGKFLAVGSVNNRDFFMFDSQAHGPPLFSFNQGASYVLKCCCLKVLLACIVLTLNIKRHNVKFCIYAVDTQINEEKDKEIYDAEVEKNKAAASATTKQEYAVPTVVSSSSYKGTPRTDSMITHPPISPQQNSLNSGTSDDYSMPAIQNLESLEVPIPPPILVVSNVSVSSKASKKVSNVNE